jgi:hypothetical protein
MPPGPSLWFGLEIIQNVKKRAAAALPLSVRKARGGRLKTRLDATGLSRGVSRLLLRALAKQLQDATGVAPWSFTFAASEFYKDR